MGITCPNKRLRSWKDLVKIQGESRSYLLWSEYDGIVPEQYYAVSKPKVITPAIKPGVESLFESNPELANAVYEALGFKNDYDGISIELGRSVDRDFGKVQNIIISHNGKPITSQDGAVGLGEMNVIIKDGEVIVGMIRLPQEQQGKGLTKYIYQAVADN